MSFSLLDVAVITGLPLDALLISPNTRFAEDDFRTPSNSYAKTGYTEWIATYMGKKNEPVTLLEQWGFMTMFFCR